MNSNKKVSIVVIIYKVSEYVRQCLESLVNQTYKNIEIICVVGDTDTESMEITKEFSEKDPRIVFMPRKPDGVSRARNAGLDAVTGDYIAFVDGDDYIDNDMIETLVDAIESEDADISIVSKYYLYQNTVEGIYNEGTKVYDTETTMKELLKGEGFFFHLWDKMYKKELFDDVRFKVGAVCEDRQICYDILNKAKKVVYVPKSKYYFRQSIDSSSKIYQNAEDSLSEDYIICDKLLKDYPGLKQDVETFLLKENLSMIQSSFLYGVYSPEHDKKYFDYVKKHMFKGMKGLSKGQIAKTFLCILFPRKFGEVTLKRRKAFLESHVHFSNGNDWESLFRAQGIKI